jgi:hypothetical protein
MGDLDKEQTSTLTELMVSTLAMVDAMTKILVDKGLMSEAEFREKMSQERARYQALVSEVR